MAKQTMSELFPDIEEKQCVLLWKSVLNRALSDALKGSNIIKKSAIRWFFGEKDRDFYRVCNWAQVSHQKVRDFLLKELAKQGSDIIKNALYTEYPIGRFPRVAQPYKSIPKIDLSSPISLIYEGLEICAYIVDEKHWFNISRLNGLWKFCDTQNVGIVDIDTFIDPAHLQREAINKVVLFSDIVGIEQLATSFSNKKLKLFANWVKSEKHKQNILEKQNIFKLKFQDHSILACLYKDKLFLHFVTVLKTLSSTPISFKKEIREKDKYFYAFLEAKTRQLMVRTDLLAQLIEERKTKPRCKIETKLQLIQWLKEQQQLFEGSK